MTREEDPGLALVDPVVEDLASQVVSSTEVGGEVDVLCCISSDCLAI